MPRGQRPLWGRTKATMDQSKATFPLECLCQPLRAKAYKGGNLAKLWSISSGRGAIFIYGTIQSCWNFTRRQLSPILKFECKPLLVIVSNPSSGNKFNEKKIKLKQMRFSIFCHRPSSRANVSLPRLDRSVIGSKLVIVISWQPAFPFLVELKLVIGIFRLPMIQQCVSIPNA